MFSIYDSGASTFRGTLEQLYEIGPVRRMRKTDAEGGEGETAPEGGLASSDHEPSQARRAESAYRQALHLKDDREPVYHVRQIMSRTVLTVRPETKLGEAWMQFRENRIRQMPVQGADLRLVGMLDLDNLLEKITIEGGQVRYAPDLPVAEVMSSPVITADPVTDIRRIAKVLADRDLHGVPVVSDQDELVGLVTRGDILRKLANTPPLRLWS